MNAPTDSPSRAEQQALSAPFLIEDQEIVRMIAQIADERGTAMQEIVKSAMEYYLRRHQAGERGPEWLERFWTDHPLPLPTGLVADKRFFDALSGDL